MVQSELFLNSIYCGLFNYLICKFILGFKSRSVFMNQKDSSSYLTRRNFINFGIVCVFVYLVNTILYIGIRQVFYGQGNNLLQMAHFNPLMIFPNAPFMFLNYGESLPFLMPVFSLSYHGVFATPIVLGIFFIGLVLNFVAGVLLSDKLKKLFPNL